MVLELPGGLFGQGDVRETPGSTATASIQTGTLSKTSGISDTTANNSYEDMTGASITLGGLDAAKTYSIGVIATIQQTRAGTATAGLQLVIGSTTMQANEVSTSSTINKANNSVADALTGQTGATSYTAKLQHKISGGTVTSTGSMMMIVVEE